MNFTDLPRTIRTASHLRPSQIAWRLVRRCQRMIGPATPEAPGNIAVAAELPEVLLPADRDPPGQRLLDELERGVFRHLNRGEELGPPPVDWRLGPVNEHRLWTVTLHYHRWALDLGRLAAAGGDRGRRASKLLADYLDDWLTRCHLQQPGAHHLAWNPYAIATRLGHWARLDHEVNPAFWQDRPNLRDRFLESFGQQALYLERHLEWDLRGNHLMRDAVGLAWAGRFFTGPPADRWLREATRLALDQLEEQVLADGMHFERSPMYHLQVMHDVLTLAQLVTDASARQKLRETWRAMAECAAWLAHPDGQIPLLNDSASGGAPDPASMIAAGNAALDLEVDPIPRRGGCHLREAGLAIHHGPGWSLFLDLGSPGPAYQPGHAHAHTLTFECAWRGQRLIVDPGTFAYDHDEARRYDRATASHNTLTLDGHDSSEAWHIFRMGRRARITDSHVSFTEAGMHAAAAHDGYRFLPGSPRHRRSLELDQTAGLTLTDTVEGGGGGGGRTHEVRSTLLIHPDWIPERLEGNRWRLRHRDEERAAVQIAFAGPPSLAAFEEEAPYHPDFGLALAARRLVWACRAPLPLKVTTRITPTTPTTPTACATASAADARTAAP